MKIYRGPRTSNQWQETDTKDLVKWAKDWEPGKTVKFDGTITKRGGRHTDLGVEVESNDIIALHDALLRFQKKRTDELEKLNAELSTTVDLLQNALSKIDSLISFHSERAPSRDELLSTVQKIAAHFQWGITRNQPFKIKWIKWKSI